MSIYEFFAYCSYILYKQAKEQQKIREFKIKNRIR